MPTRWSWWETVIQTTPLDPGQSYAGKIVLQKVTSTKRPERVSIVVNWNGEQYPFAFQLAKPGTPSPAFTAIAPAAARPLPAPPVAVNAVARQPDLGALISKTALYRSGLTNSTTVR